MPQPTPYSREVDLLRAEAAVFPSRGPHSAPLDTNQAHLVKRIADLLTNQRFELLADKPVKLSPVEQLAQAVLDGRVSLDTHVDGLRTSTITIYVEDPS